jgi:hypothetical protein
MKKVLGLILALIFVWFSLSSLQSAGADSAAKRTAVIESIQ